ncbi:basic leucine zipper transcriptional factor ATF-like 2 [Scomber scombrus]|uniref:basic leucine zipper transcriptional factor ATF-like 2 n=1 Tax=Scomber scombrus TaxID=13677 RepID=UPI002DD88B14|nr:basic leucine zipper transcriptional factor ATF-like 2 [Scomber scombrus]
MLLPETYSTDQPVCSVEGAQDMSPLFMDTVYESNSSGSLSADCNSNTAGSEKEGEGPGTQYRGTKRRQKNREAARKSRKKQTERADELHEELQHLEQSNSALQKEIATLKKEASRFTTVLEQHKPFCCLRASGSSLTNRLSVSPSPVDTTLPQNSSSPSKNPHQTSCSTLTAAPSPSTSATPSLGHHTHDCADNTQPSPSSGLPAELFTTSSSSSTTSGSLARPLAQPASLVPPLGDPLSDLSLSEFLEVNDWILSGTSNL